MENREMRQVRSVGTTFTTRKDGDNPVIEGYFVRFDDKYQIWENVSESVAKGAFVRSLADGDVRALVNHDTTLVLGRTKAKTLELKEDDTGLWGKILVNSEDSDAMNEYQRIKRGDVTQCSFGFDIRDEDCAISDNGTVHWTIKDVDLYEVSVCTFPAYERTGVEARAKQLDEIKERKAKAWKESMKERLKKWH